MSLTEKSYAFDFSINRKSIIKVIGVGGGGSNAVNFMFNQGIRDVDFIICNTDNQALQTSPVHTKLQLGENINHGLGAGGNPIKGREAAMDSREAIKEVLSDGTKMVFITAGMGGGTGSGAAPVIAQIARELGILTVGIVTLPFSMEGVKKMKIAEESVAEMRAYCDTVIEICNDKISEMFPTYTFRKAFGCADAILTTAAKSISELITMPAYVNVDFEDVKAVMANSGYAVMGSSAASGEDRAIEAVKSALSSPLLQTRDINGAQKILVSIITSEDHEATMQEITDICEFVQEKAGNTADLKYGCSIDNSLSDTLRVTVVVTGFEVSSATKQPTPVSTEPAKIQMKADVPVEADIVPPKPEAARPVYPTPTVGAPVFPDPESLNEKHVAPTAQAGEGDEIRESKPEKQTVEAGTGPMIVDNLPPKENYHYVDLTGQSILSYSSPEGVERPLIDVDKMLSEENGLKDRLRSYNTRLEFDTDTIKRLETPAYKRLRKEASSPDLQQMQQPSRYTISPNMEIVNNNKFLHDRPD
jgi:cell division protein FtsZ